jgi:hypothetical protein
MDRDSYLAHQAVIRRAAEHGAWQVIGPTDGDITSAEESVVRSNRLAGVFCEECQRWIGLYQGIEADTALERHAELFHAD